MTYKSILAAVSGRPEDADALRSAIQLAAACGGTVTVLPAFPDLASELSLGALPISPEAADKLHDLEDGWMQAVIRMTEEVKAAELRIHQQAGLGVCVAPREGARWLSLMKHIPLTDLTVMAWAGARNPEALGGVLSDVMFNLKAPVLIARGQQPVVDRPAAVAWDNSPEAGRALHAALPLLRKATAVLVLQDPDGLDWQQQHGAAPARLIDYLAMHGVLGVTVREVRGRREGPALVEAAMAFGASVLVSGAYSHSRLQEWIFGGATQAFLSSPVGPHLLLAH